MPTLARWNPLGEMEDLHHRLSRWFGAPARTGNSGTSLENMMVADWAPSVDISENEQEWLIKADLPEVKKEDVRVSVEEGVLSLSGVRRLEKEEKGQRYHRIERVHGTFVRSFTLPDNADGAKVNAEFKDGVLKIHLPKTAKAKPKAVEVKVS